MDLTNKVALVTGGASTVGKVLVLKLAQAGANVVINYYSSEAAAQQTVVEAKNLGVQALAVQCDVSDYLSVKSMSEKVKCEFGGVDILVNSASHFEKTPFPCENIELWNRVTRILIDGAFFVCNSFVPTMVEKGSGNIINIVDLSAWNPWPNYMAHAVGKSALLAMTRQLAIELAPNIRANAIAPGPVVPPTDIKITHPRRTVLPRWGSPEDVAEAMIYLIRAEYVTGEVIMVDGGEHLGKCEN